jgi:hypothetical protein
LYVEPTGRAACRVYYSCECKLRGWVPPPVYNILTKEALKKATTWVDRESVREWRASRSGLANEALVHFVSNLREGAANMRLPQAPRFVDNWVSDRRQAAIRFASNVRSAKSSTSRW